MVVAVGRWSLFGGGFYLRFDYIFCKDRVFLMAEQNGMFASLPLEKYVSPLLCLPPFAVKHPYLPDK